uniref:cellulase N-terminal Ig-like domain-containing protein n=1 Tax=Acetatifactor sp. TaxID=1872090 RepID=UPI00405617CE
MKATAKIAWVLTISLLVGVCSGCGTDTEMVTGENYYAAATGMESTPIIEYTVPQLTANVLVNRMGYPAEGAKEATVKGKELPEEFCLINADTGEVVYQGTIEKAEYNTEAESYVGYAVFDDYKQPGNYYLECDKIGRSYTFTIVSDLYIELFKELSGQVLNECSQQTASVSEITALLTTYEWYPQLFGDEDEDEVPDVLELLMEWLKNCESSDEDIEDDVMNAALLAKFSYLYQKYDKKQATAFLQRASALFEKSQNTMQKDADSFFALTELYRASGLTTYGQQIEEYISYFENSSSFGSEREYLYGAMTYMVTRQKVNVDLCNILLDKMMDRGEEISNRCDDMTHPLTAKNNGEEEILTCASEVIFVNYVLNSYQYHQVLEELLHYLGGKNRQSVSFYPGEEDCAGYLLILAQLTTMPTEKE